MAIYAIDFDNTLAITRFPEIVAPNKKMVAFAKMPWSGADCKDLYLMP